MARRRPPLRMVGSDPDYRFTLANERTFLAWLRTGLALVAGAVALAGLLPNFGPPAIRVSITVLLLVLAVTVTVGAYARWERAERALREGASLPVGLLPRLIVTGLVIVIAASAVLLLFVEAGGTR